MWLIHIWFFLCIFNNKKSKRKDSHILHISIITALTIKCFFSFWHRFNRNTIILILRPILITVKLANKTFVCFPLMMIMATGRVFSRCCTAQTVWSQDEDLYLIITTKVKTTLCHRKNNNIIALHMWSMWQSCDIWRRRQGTLRGPRGLDPWCCWR